MITFDIEQVFPDLDPGLEQALEHRLQQFEVSFNDRELSPEIFNHPDSDLSAEFIRLMLFSEYAAVSLTRSPEILDRLIRSGDLFNPYDSHVYRDKLENLTREMSDESGIKSILREVKRYESIRIAWRDLNRYAGLSETLQDLSNLADACIDKALQPVYEQCVGQYGTPLDQHANPQQMIILGMGKLGAGELNFSSDIDLIFVYPEPGVTAGERSISNEEFFTKVCRRFIKMFDSASHEGNLYRVDTRLRPFGDGGPLVMSAAAFEAYYEAQGREWERYALIKARPVAGDLAQGNLLLERLKPFIYRRYFDYGTFDSLRDMKSRITLQVKNARLKSNIKLGQGGIREIEFFGQIFQMIRGGVEPDLQERSLLKVLAALEAHAIITWDTRNDLAQAYEFLRHLENRLQMYADLQTHDLPSDKSHLMIMALSMGYDETQALIQALESYMKTVNSHFRELLVSDEDRAKDGTIQDLKELWININDPQYEGESLNIEGFEDPKAVLNALRELEEHPNTKRLTSNGRKKLARLIPLLIRELSVCDEPESLLNRLIDLIITIERRTCYLSLLIENSAALENLIKLASKSQWIITFLAKHPMLLDELLNPASLYSPPKKTALVKEIEQRLSKIEDTDTEYLLEELSVFKQINTLRVSAADISGDYPLMKVSDHLTWIAEAVLEKVLEISWKTVVGKYGLPEGVTEHGLDTCGFIIVAYGKVGGFEMGYKSDLDLVFLYKGIPGMTTGSKSIDNNMFYSNLGQRIINALTVHTSVGTLYQADMRLRPGGTSGMIVSHIEAWEDYMLKQAWTWEHQALIRARPICGDTGLIQEFEACRHQVLRRGRETSVLNKEVFDMRERMRKEHIKIEPGSFDLKQGRGGLIDIEFLVQYLILNFAQNYPELSVWTDNIRLLESLETEGIILPEQGEQLQSAYLEIRRAIHRYNLLDQPLMAPEEQFARVRNTVTDLYDTHLKGGDEDHTH